MFTIKWIVNTPFGEQIRMFEAREVAVAYRDQVPPGYSQRVERGCPVEVAHWELAGRSVERGSLFVMDPYEANFAGRSFDVGTVYVMNETGATVGKYVLDASIQAAAEPLAISTS